jgi:hypothetical protein
MSLDARVGGSKFISHDFRLMKMELLYLGFSAVLESGGGGGGARGLKNFLFLC